MLYSFKSILGPILLPVLTSYLFFCSWAVVRFEALRATCDRHRVESVWQLFLEWKKKRPYFRLLMAWFTVLKLTLEALKS